MVNNVFKKGFVSPVNLKRWQTGHIHESHKNHEGHKSHNSNKSHESHKSHETHETQESCFIPLGTPLAGK